MASTAVLLLFCCAIFASEKIIRARANFTTGLFKTLAGEENLVFSSYAIQTILALVYEGSDGTTRETLKQVLKFPPPETLAEEQRNITHSLKSIEDVTIVGGTTMCLSDRFKLNYSFVSVADEAFDAKVETVVFSKQDEADVSISNWVANRTHIKIKDLVNPTCLDRAATLVLLNGIVFQGEWLYKFRREDTKLGMFYLNDKDTKNVEMMQMKSDKLRYLEDNWLDAKILQLPYVRESVKMVFVLPNKRDGVGAVKRKLFSGEFNCASFLNPSESKVIKVSLPKFSIESALNLKKPLTDMGLAELFSSRANFSNILEDKDDSSGLKLNEIIQNTYIQVNEEGSAIESATGVEVHRNTSQMPNAEDAGAEFVADHPFIFFLTMFDEYHINILAGQVYNP